MNDRLNENVHALLMLTLLKKKKEGLIFVKVLLNRSTKTVRLCSLWMVVKVLSTKGCDVGRPELFGTGNTHVQCHLQLCYYSKKLWRLEPF